MRAQWKIPCEFDGSLSPPHVADLLPEGPGGPAWRASEVDRVAGRIGVRARMRDPDMPLRIAGGRLDVPIARIPDTTRPAPAVAHFPFPVPKRA